MNDVVSFSHSAWEQSAQQRVVREGLVALEADAVRIEVRTRRQDFSTMTTTDEGTRSWRLPLGVIDGIEIRPRLFGGVTLRLRTRSLAVLDGLPGCAGREFRAAVPRSDRDAARALAAHLADRLADRVLRQLHDEERPEPGG